ncbi:MAG TPA: cysteine peptidase family C39 domain-containing protein [Kiritimatiellia bacterium]
MLRLCVAGLLPVLAGCSVSTGASRSGLGVDLLELARRKRTDCGAVCLAEALRRCGAAVDRQMLLDEMGPASRGGYSMGELCSAAEAFGFAPSLERGSLEELRSRTDQGGVCIVAVSRGNGGNHAVLVLGVEDAADGSPRIRIADPAGTGESTKPASWLEERWAKLGRPMLTLVNGDQLAGLTPAPGLASIRVGESESGVNIPLLVVGSGAVIALAAYEAANGEP